MAVINRIAGYAEEMAAWRRWLHRNPELEFDLPKTSAFVAERLREFGVDELHEGLAETGMVAIVNGRGSGPTIGLRADMDALPIMEATGADHASETPGKMHACGHDGHTTMLLGAARYLCETRNFSGRVALIFQPAEESGSGARRMVEEGLMDRFGISRVFGIHNEPALPFGHFATRPGPLMASVDEFDVTVTGKGGHAAYPDLSVDPIPALLAVAQAFDTIVSRNRGSTEAMVVSVTRIEAGTAYNITPAAGTLCGTVRAFSKDTQDMVERRMREICDGVAAAFGVDIAFTYRRDNPVTVNDDDEAAFAVRVASDLVGADKVNPNVMPVMGGEDFSEMLLQRPGAFVFLGQGTPYFCHHPAYDFNDEIAPIGASFFVRLVETAQPPAEG
ncbi:M20 aminoacylase family protein [Ovoidimarina sediminis]|uniref:M20 aminoacylase family protein n=1 Tax=Ovoidimarina sediminis TaxID=3079856 RepID=UPI0029129365|nr:M20 aminoacylase family protein [Rhodophyticola sp. MJ-SS7]MDU8945664.1 M20 aminoacylase family protein [Rhodophyticola sp. MJ-SS7]